MQPNSDYYLCTEEEGLIVEPYLPDKSGTIAEKYQQALAQTQVIYKTNQKLLLESLALAPQIVELEEIEAKLIDDEKVGREKRAGGQAKMKEVGRAMTSQRTEWQTEKIRMSKSMILQEAKLANLTRQLNSLKEKTAEATRITKEMHQKRYAVDKILRTMRRKVAKLKGEELPPDIGSAGASSIGSVDDGVASSIGDDSESQTASKSGGERTRKASPRRSRNTQGRRTRKGPMESVSEAQETDKGDAEPQA
jgi:hypothetical protein